MQDRRFMLKGLVAAPLLASSSALAATPGKTLKDIAGAKGIRFGTAVSHRQLLGDPRASTVIAQECAVIVPENELKMYVTHNVNATAYNFAPADDMLAWCDSHHLQMRGHNLIWARDEFTPSWLKAYDFGSQPKLAAEKLMRDYIATVAQHYGNRLVSWDVINEAVDPETGTIRQNVFTRILGDEALRIAFEAAREHLPHMQLVYNDYMNWEKNGSAHRDGVIRLLRWFRDHKIPVDALGLQSHLGTDHDLLSADPDAWKAFLDAASGMDYQLLITEFDVNDKNLPADIKTRDEAVARTARTYLDLTLSYKGLKDFLCWGIDDKTNWLQTFSKRSDGLPLRPVPFDADFKRKPLWHAIADCLAAASAR